MSPARINRPKRVHPDFPDAYEVVASGCWEWRGHVDSNGYGKGYDATSEPNRYDWAHRLSFRRFKGAIPAGHEVDHVCQNTVCVNPDHLDAVTKTEHVRRTFQRLGFEDKQLRVAYLRQMKLTYAEIAEAMGYTSLSGARDAVLAAIAKGLVAPEDCPPAKRLSDVERLEIRDLSDWGLPYDVIADMYGIDNSHVSRVVNGKTSGHSRAAA